MRDGGDGTADFAFTGQEYDPWTPSDSPFPVDHRGPDGFLLSSPGGGATEAYRVADPRGIADFGDFDGDGNLDIVCTDENIIRIFEITGLDRIFGIFSSRGEALKAASA